MAKVCVGVGIAGKDRAIVLENGEIIIVSNQEKIFGEKIDAGLISAKKAETLIDEVRIDLDKIYNTPYDYEVSLMFDLKKVIDKMKRFRGIEIKKNDE